MKTGYKIVLIPSIILLAFISSWIIVNMIGDISPYDDWAGNHIEDLKKIPHVAAFYNHYGDDILIWEESGRFYQLGFQFLSEDKRSHLIVIFFAGKPYSVSYSCHFISPTDLERIIQIRNAKPSEIINCFS